jgi:DNA-binding NarL/FixJ family response regulator
VTAPAPHPYCPHDEGEICSCTAELRPHIPATERKRSRRATRVETPAEQFAAVASAVDDLTAKGWAAREIAAWLGIGERTVYRARERGRAG